MENPGLIFYYILVVFVKLGLNATHVKANDAVAEYCEKETFQAECSDNEVILITMAKYGRMEIGRCITQSYGHIGCNVDVLDVLDSFCSGSQSCQVGASHPALLDKKQLSCPKDLAGYLQVSYHCIKVSNTQGPCVNNGLKDLMGDSGIISSSLKTSGQGCPFHIVVPVGKRINTTIYNFLPAPASDQLMVSSSACYEVATIKDGKISKTVHKCLSDPRQKALYVSSSHILEIQLTEQGNTNFAGHFLIEYKATGCPSPEVPKNARLEVDQNHARIVCENTEQSWLLVCQNNVWKGNVGECTADKATWSFLGLFDSTHPYGTAIVVGLGATLGVLTGGILLYILIAIFKKCQSSSDYSMTYEYTDPNFARIPADYHADKAQLFPQENIFDQKFGTLGSHSAYNNSTMNRDNTNHSRVPLPPLPNGNNTLSYEKPLCNRNDNPL